jgi:hypothetical protein
MATKKDYEALEIIARAALAKFDPAESECEYMSGGKQYRIITPKAGEVCFMIDRDTPENKRGEAATISIFSRFDNPQAARALGFDCNQFSGKWNHHFLWSMSHISAVFTELQNRAF